MGRLPVVLTASAQGRADATRINEPDPAAALLFLLKGQGCERRLPEALEIQLLVVFHTCERQRWLLWKTIRVASLDAI